MKYDLQKASPMKRLAAWLLDAILLCVLTTCFVWALWDVAGMSAKSDEVNAIMEQCETKYGITFIVDQESYNALSAEERAIYDQNYKAAEEELSSNSEYLRLQSAWIQGLILVVCIGVFIAKLLLEFLVPLWLGNGQTAGKKAFGIAVMRTNSVRITNVRLFIRAILGKYTVETMIPLMLLLLSMLSLGITGIILILVIVATQIIMMITTPTSARLHDLMADTVVVDMHSQLIFDSEQARTEYLQRIAAEKAQQST